MSLIKSKNLHFKQKFLTEKFIGINFFKEDCYSSFFIQFLPYLEFITFSKNDEIITSKLKDLGFSNTSLKYLTTINDLELEIKKLEETEGLHIFPYQYLFASYTYITTKFKIESYESFFGTSKYNGTEVNNLFIDTFKRSRRNNNKTSSDEFYFDKKMNDLCYSYDRLTTNEIYNSKKRLLKIYNGNYSVFSELFQFHHTTISKNDALEILFPLFMLIFKDKKLLNETDFFDYYDKILENSGEQFYDKNYRKYKISKVRDILKEK
ncbi:MAG: hypothetical protein KBC58_03565 [Flavobacterium sp.]|nr:hypothetical protein [Flavobacterium sp.]